MSKGSVDMTVLLVMLAPMILLLIFAAHFMAEQSLRGNLYAEVAFSENEFRSQTAHTQLMNSSMRNKIGFYRFKNDPDERNQIKNQIRQNVEAVLGSTSPYYAFRASQGLGYQGDLSDALSGGTPPENNIVVVSDRTGNTVRFKSFVASPYRDPVSVTTSIGAAGETS